MEETNKETERETPAGKLARRGGEGVPLLRFQRRADAPKLHDFARGTLAELFYTATSIEGAPRKRALVYLPRGYTAEKEYRLIVLLHGIGGDENEWLYPAVAGPSRCRDILDAFNADGGDVIAVFPNGRTSKSFDVTSHAADASEYGSSEVVRGFYEFDRELRADLLPAVEAAYSVSKDRAMRAVAGFSMGGMQAVNLGVKCCDLFSSIGGFSCAPTTQCGVLAGLAVRESGLPMNTVYLVCGDADEISYPVFGSVTEGFGPSAGEYLKSFVQETVEGGKHDFGVWNVGLEHFLPLAFPKEEK